MVARIVARLLWAAILLLAPLWPSAQATWNLLGQGSGVCCGAGYGAGYGTGYSGHSGAYGSQGYVVEAEVGEDAGSMSPQVANYITGPTRPVFYIIRKKYYRPLIERTTIELAHSRPSYAQTETVSPAYTQPRASYNAPAKPTYTQHLGQG